MGKRVPVAVWARGAGGGNQWRKKSGAASSCETAPL
jgi:hypothetical protein